MLFTTELLNRLEQDTELKKSYAAQGSMGQNRLIALPVILGLFAAFGAYELYDLSKTDPDYKTYAIICACCSSLFGSCDLYAKECQKRRYGKFRGCKSLHRKEDSR